MDVFGHAERELIDGGERAEALGDVADLDGRHGRGIMRQVAVRRAAVLPFDNLVKNFTLLRRSRPVRTSAARGFGHLWLTIHVSIKVGYGALPFTCYEPDLPAQCQCHRPNEPHRGAVPRRPGGLGRVHPHAIVVGHETERVRRAADPVQPRPPRRRRGHRLPLLPYVSREVFVRGHPADQDVHELPFGAVQQRAHPRAGARELQRRQAVDVD